MKREIKRAIKRCKELIIEVDSMLFYDREEDWRIYKEMMKEMDILKENIFEKEVAEQIDFLTKEYARAVRGLQCKSEIT